MVTRPVLIVSAMCSTFMFFFLQLRRQHKGNKKIKIKKKPTIRCFYKVDRKLVEGIGQFRGERCPDTLLLHEFGGCGKMIQVLLVL